MARRYGIGPLVANGARGQRVGAGESAGRVAGEPSRGSQEPSGRVARALHKIDGGTLGAGRVVYVEYVVEAAACALTEAAAQAS